MSNTPELTDTAATASDYDELASGTSVSTDQGSTPRPSGSGAAQSSAAAASSSKPDRSNPISAALSENYKKINVKKWGEGDYNCDVDESDRGKINLDKINGTIEREQIPFPHPALKGTGSWAGTTVHVVLCSDKTGYGGKEVIDLYNRRW